MVRSELVSALPPPGSQFPSKQIFPPESSQKPEELQLVPHCAFIDVVAWGNKVKAVSLPRTRVERHWGEAEGWGRGLCLWHYALNGYLSSPVSTDVKRGKRGKRVSNRKDEIYSGLVTFWDKGWGFQSSSWGADPGAAAGKALAGWAQKGDLSWMTPCFCGFGFWPLPGLFIHSFIHSFIYGCVGSSFLCEGFL